MGIFNTIKGMFEGGSSTVRDFWNIPVDKEDVQEIMENSQKRPQLIYKHSFRCSMCLFSKSDLEEASDAILERASMHFVDVVGSRPVSNYIAEETSIPHQSPQVLLIVDEEVIYEASHNAISAEDIVDILTGD